MLRDHPLISHVTQEFHAEQDGRFTSHWVVHTPLVLDALDPGYKIESVNQLISAVQDHCRDMPELKGRIIIRESERRAAE